ncbi:MAG: terpene cyclase/mutase family protein [Oscillospiraceae bacterium]|nr:terpene cyclase/mutase family protein [Oscillospiraceae bacterium]
MKTIKKCIAVVLTILLLVSMCGCTSGNSSQHTDNQQYDSTISKTAQWLLTTKQEPVYGSIGGEWLVLGLSRSETEVPEGYYENYYQNVTAYVKQCDGILDNRKYTEYSRVILALTAIGKNPADVAGYNLLVPLADFEQTIFQGVNGPVYALLALDSGDYEIPENIADSTQATRQMYVDYILSKEAAEGGWSLAGSEGDVEITAMVLQALAGYMDQQAVKEAVERGLQFISEQQNDNGGFASFGAESSESISQVMVALAELGISPDDSRFVKNGNSLYKRLLEFMMDDGSFCHVQGSEKGDIMATEQAFYAIVATDRAAQGKTSLYKMP